MVYSSNKAETNFVTAFLSFSVRPEDRPLVDAIEDRVSSEMGFRCLTVERNISIPAQVDDAVRDLVQRVLREMPLPAVFRGKIAIIRPPSNTGEQRAQVEPYPH